MGAKNFLWLKAINWSYFMDMSSTISSLSSGLTQADKVGTSVLKKAMDIQKDTATQLIESIPPMPSAPTGSLGHNFDAFA